MAKAEAAERDLRQHILDTAARLFYANGARAVGVDLVTKEAGIAKTSIYRHFGTKDDLIAAYLESEDTAFWQQWDSVHQEHVSDPGGELAAQLSWIKKRLSRPGYRGCPQLNVAAEFPEATHPARKVAIRHKKELAERLTKLAEAMRVSPNVGRQLALLIDGAFADAALGLGVEAGDALSSAAGSILASHVVDA